MSFNNPNIPSSAYRNYFSKTIKGAKPVYKLTLSREDFIKSLYRTDLETSDTYSHYPYLNYLIEFLDQEFLNTLLMETLLLKNRSSIYIENVLLLLSELDLSKYKIDVTVFKTLAKKTDMCTVDGCLRFIEKQPQIFTEDFVRSLEINSAKWLVDYRDSILEDYKDDFRKDI